MAHRTADRTERWDRDRYEFERERDRYGDVRERFEEDEDRGYVRRGPSSARGPPPRDDRSVGPSPSDTRFSDRRPRGGDDDEVVFRERRRVVYEDDEPPPRFARRRAPSSPPPPPAEYRRRAVSPPPELERSRVVIEKERYRSPSPEPPRRPTRLLRRQSSLDTFDRAPAKRYWEREAAGGREPYGPPARRGDVDPRDRLPPYNVDIPLPRSRALPPPRVYAEREYYDEIQVSDPHRYGDDDFHAPSFPPPPAERERVREKEVVRTRRRTRSRESRATASRRSRSRSSSTSSSSSSSGGTTLTARSEYPKKGKTRVPARLVSKRALIDLGYPFVEEGNVIIVQKALGQQNIDDLLKLSDDYKKSELEIIAARSSAGDIIEERIEHRTEIYEGAAALNAPPPAPVIVQAPPAGGHGHGHGHGPVIIQAPSPATPAVAAPPVEVVKTTVVRDVSPARTYTTSSYDSTTSYDTYTTSTTATPVIVEARPPPGVSAAVPLGPVALAEAPTMAVARRRRDSLDSAADLRSEIRHLERQLARKEHSGHGHRRGHSRHRSASRGGELVRAERLSTGELVLFEEEVEQIQEPTRGSGVRIEKDKRGPPPRLMKAMLATLT